MKFWNEITKEEEIAEACEDAAALLEGHWAKGSWFTYIDADGDGDADYEEAETWGYCIEGAMAAAIGLDATDMECESEERSKLLTCPVYQAVVTTMNLRAEREETGEEYGIGDLPNWNDGEHGSEQGALDILHETAKRMRGVEA